MATNVKNEIPPGGKPSDVADDVNINASEGEYIIPANVVRFLGLKNIEKLVGKAKDSLAEMESKGKLSGPIDDQSTQHENLPFDPNELTVIDDGQPGEAPTQSFATGGEVKNPKNDFTGIKEFKNSDGQIMYIPFLYGEPQQAVPDGYAENDPTKVSSKAPDPTQHVDSGQAGGMGGTASNTPSNNQPGQTDPANKVSPLAGDPKNWSYKDFINFDKQKGSVGEMAIKGMIGMMPLGGIAMKAREKYLDSQTADLMDHMLETGVDPQGTPLTDAQKLELSTTREHLKSQMSDQTGLNLNPIEKIGQAFNQFTNFISGKAPGVQQPAPATPAAPTGNVGAPLAGTSINQQTYKNAQAHGSTGSYGGGSYGMGSDIGRSPSAGPSAGSMASGGLYAEGGLITRRKK